MTKRRTAIEPTREDFSGWYQSVIKEADLAESSSVRGCMIIKPWGYALWEKIQGHLDAAFKSMGVDNVYCPLLIPMQAMQKEADHVSGFAMECAVVTHTRLQKDAEGQLSPTSPLEDPYIIRPTSEIIIGEMFSRWVSSHRDLPIRVNQWANVMRWEMRPRAFLRTSEFLWQEGHTVHQSATEAEEETRQMIRYYHQFITEMLAIFTIEGEKPESERFPGAEMTLCVEAVMQDGKALQMGTSHFLGQNFARANNISYSDSNGQDCHAWTTSWGMSTRLIGGLIMSHGDDDGLLLPPRIAPQHVVIIPIIHDQAMAGQIISYCQNIATQLSAITYHDQPLRVQISDQRLKGGAAAWHWVKKGVPIRLEVGRREMEAGTMTVFQRHHPVKQSQVITAEVLQAQITTWLEEQQSFLLEQSQRRFLKQLTVVDSEIAFRQHFADNPQPGVVAVYWAGDLAQEEAIKKQYSISIRCQVTQSWPWLEELSLAVTGQCPFTGKQQAPLVLFAKAY